MKNFEAGLDNVYESLVTESYSKVPEVDTDDFVMFLQWMAKRTNEDGDALYTPLNIADVVAEPHHYNKEFAEYLSWRESEFGNPILHPELSSETKTAPDGHYYTKSGNLVKGRLSADAEERGARRSDPKDKQRSKTPPVSQYNEEIGGRGTITIVGSREHPGERKLLYTIDGSKEYQVGGIDFKNLTTGEIVTSNERIHTQLSRAIRFNPDFQEDGQPKYDVTSAATRASRDAGGPMTEVGDFKVSILWNEEEPKPLEVGESWNFKLVPESTPKQ